MPAELPRQHNMFTGEWDDPRSPRQQQRDAERALAPGKQVEMFPPAATAGDLPAHKTNGADAEHGKRSTDSTRDAARTKTPDVDDAQAEVARLHWTLYLALIQLCEEDAETVWIDPLYKGRYAAQIQATILECRTAGLTNEEIVAAIQIGQQRGNVQRRGGSLGQPESRH